MPLFAERFLMEDDGVVDLATAESVRLTIERAGDLFHVGLGVLIGVPIA